MSAGRCCCCGGPPAAAAAAAPFDCCLGCSSCCRSSRCRSARICWYACSTSSSNASCECSLPSDPCADSPAAVLGAFAPPPPPAAAAMPAGVAGAAAGSRLGDVPPSLLPLVLVVRRWRASAAVSGPFIGRACCCAAPAAAAPPPAAWCAAVAAVNGPLGGAGSAAGGWVGRGPPDSACVHHTHIGYVLKGRRPFRKHKWCSKTHSSCLSSIGDVPCHAAFTCSSAGV